MLIFAFIYAGVVGIFNLSISSEITRATTLKKESPILLIGDSHIECSVNDLPYEQLENRATSGEFYYFTYHRIKNLVTQANAENKKIRAIGVTFHVNSMHPEKDIFLLNDNIKSHYITTYTPIFRKRECHPHLYNIPITDSSLSLLLMSYLPQFYDIKGLLTVRKFRNMENYSGGFRSTRVKPFTYNEAKLKRMMTQLYAEPSIKSDSDSKFSTLQVNHLELIAQLAKNHHIPLVLINTPLHKDYNSHIPEKHKRQLLELADSLQRKFGAIYLDYHDMSLPDSHFRDYNHLNPTGAAVFTPILLKDLKKHGLIE